MVSLFMTIHCIHARILRFAILTSYLISTLFLFTVQGNSFLHNWERDSIYLMCDNSSPFHAVFERHMWASSANILFHWFDGQSSPPWYTDQDDFASDLCGEGLDIASLFNLRHKPQRIWQQKVVQLTAIYHEPLSRFWNASNWLKVKTTNVTSWTWQLDVESVHGLGIPSHTPMQYSPLPVSRVEESLTYPCNIVNEVYQQVQCL